MKLDTLAPPPSPAGINQFPTAPPKQLLGKSVLPNQETENYNAVIGKTRTVQEDQVLSVYGQWVIVVQATAAPDTPFSQTVATTTGTSTTKSTTKQFGASLGAAADLVSIGASLSITTSISVSFSKSETTTRVFNATPQSGQATISWWQKVITYEIEGTTKHYLGDMEINDTPFNNTMVNHMPTYVSTQYPAMPSDKAEVMLDSEHIEMIK